jgi:hypothetical protein
MAHSGKTGTALFKNAIVASPYLPMQWNFDGAAPENSYNRFVEMAGCFDYANSTSFECLQGKDTISLQNASAYVSANGAFGQWAFLPVTDGEFLIKRPSEQLLAREVNGLRILSGVRDPNIPIF